MKNVFLNNLATLLIVLSSAALFFSCSSEKRESFTSGSLTMMTSEDVYPVINIQVQDFQRIYEKANITNYSTSSRDAIVQLLQDSIPLVVCARPLNDEERNAAVKNETEIDSIKIAYDGVAVVVHEKNALARLTTEELRQIVTGKAQRWSAIRESKLSSTIVIALGDPNSGVHEYVKQRIAPNEPLSPTAVATSSSSEALKFISEHPNAIGFVGTAWLSSLPTNVRVLEIGDRHYHRDSVFTEMEYFQPHQAYIYQKLYPLSRTIFVYSHGIGKGVGRGFISFAASSDGQKIIVSNGLVPATMPVRLVQLQTP